MSFYWWDFLEVAEMLVRNSDISNSEANLRTAIGRAYYAAYRSLSDSAERNAEFVRRGRARDHGLIITHLVSIGRGDQAGDLRLLRHLRNECDYDECIVDLKSKTAFALAISRTLRDEDRQTTSV